MEQWDSGGLVRRERGDVPSSPDVTSGGERGIYDYGEKIIVTKPAPDRAPEELS